MEQKEAAAKISIVWGKNILDFTRDPQNSGIYHCTHFRVNAELLEQDPKKIFETLLKRGWIKPSEIIL